MQLLNNIVKDAVSFHPPPNSQHPQKTPIYPQACRMVPKVPPWWQTSQPHQEKRDNKSAREYLSCVSLFIREENPSQKFSQNTFTCDFLEELGHMQRSLGIPSCKGVWESIYLALSSTVASELCHTAAKAGRIAIGQQPTVPVVLYTYICHSGI